MSEDPTTLRSLWASAHDALGEYGRAAEVAITTKSIVDWPIWLLVLAALATVFLLSRLLPLVGDLFSLLRALMHAVKEFAYDLAGKFPGGDARFPNKRQSSAQLQMLRAQRGLYSPDPAERSRWANREGEFADD